MYVEYTTPRCLLCRETSTLQLEADKLQEWMNGKFIQDVWPDKTVDEREVIKTGTHPACWAVIFADPDTDPENWDTAI